MYMTFLYFRSRQLLLDMLLGKMHVLVMLELILTWWMTQVMYILVYDILILTKYYRMYNYPHLRCTC